MAGRPLINALASTAGGGRTWLRNVLPRLARLSPPEMAWSVLVPPGEVEWYRELAGTQVRVETVAIGGGLVGRWWWEQRGLRRLIGERRIDLLLAVGNFAMWQAPVPQILFNRSDLNFSPEFRRDLRTRGEWRMWVEQLVKSFLAQISIREATVNVVPTRAFGERIQAAMKHPHLEFEVLPFGFDADLFRSEGRRTNRPKPPLAADESVWRLLYVSHYNYFRNFETLLRALPALDRQVRAGTGRGIELVLTTEIRPGAVYGGYDATAAAALIAELKLAPYLRMLGEVPYDELHALYGACDLFVCPSYAESFGHPLVEAMACGLPVMVADLPVHREVCGGREVDGGAAATFAVFDPADLARGAVELLTDEARRHALRERGLARAQDFSWDAHVGRLIELAQRVAP